MMRVLSNSIAQTHRQLEISTLSIEQRIRIN